MQMGEELIGHPSTAIGELVKNAYDADATKCYVYIHVDYEADKSFLLIHDSGLGMSKKTLFGDWLRPSISSKRGKEEHNRRSHIFERNYLGSKGIGRLAAMALGHYLTVISRTADESQYNWLKIDREAFRTDDMLEAVTFPGGNVDNPQSLFTLEHPFGKEKNNPLRNHALETLLAKPAFNYFKEGTLIILEELDEAVRTIMQDESENPEIEIDDTIFLKSLRELITPLELNRLVQNELVDLNITKKTTKIAKTGSTFEVLYGSNIIAHQDEFGDPFLIIEPIKVLDNYDYRAIGVVNRNGEVSGKYFCRRLTDFKYDEEFLLDAKDVLQEDFSKMPNRRDRETIPEELKNSEAGTFFFDIRVYDRDEDAIVKLGKALKTEGKRQTRQTLDRYLGFRISKNGFGVKPYGDEDKDWMGMNTLRVQNPAGVIGVNQILGYTFLYSPENEGLSEKTNREGFFENKAFITFKRELRAVLNEVSKRRYNFRIRYGLGRVPKPSSDRPDGSSYLQFINSRTDDKVIIDRTKRFVEETNTALDNLQNSLTFSQRLASLGSGLELIYHELSQPISQIGGIRSTLGLRARKIMDEVLRQDIETDIELLRSAVKTLNTLKESLQPAVGKAAPKDFKPSDLFTKVCYLYSADFADENIIIKITPEGQSYCIKNYEYVFWISFLNIVNNAVYWLRTLKDEPNRYIEFHVDGETIIIHNNGPRLPDNALETIFAYGVTYRKEKTATGLGLSFTKSILTSIGWDVTADNMADGPAFRINRKDDTE